MKILTSSLQGSPAAAEGSQSRLLILGTLSKEVMPVNLEQRNQIWVLPHPGSEGCHTLCFKRVRAFAGTLIFVKMV